MLPAGAAGRQFCNVLLSCVLALLMAVFVRGRKTDRMLPLVRAHGVHIPFGFASKPSYARKVTGIGDAACCGNPGICLKYAQG